MAAFSLSIAGVLVTLTPTASIPTNDGGSSSLSIQVRHCEDGHVEADVCNFSGTIVISPEQPKSCTKQQQQTLQQADENDSTENEVIVDGIPEELIVANRSAVGATTVNNNNWKQPTSILDGTKLFVPLSPHRSCSTPTFDSTDNEEDKENNNTILISPSNNNGTVNFHPSTTTTSEAAQDAGGNSSEANETLDLSFHEACAFDEAKISDLRQLLRNSPHLASIQDTYGDYPAHIFARNEAFIYTTCDDDVQEFAYELYLACPSAFLSEGYDGQIPFAGIICDWVDDCHQLYARSSSGVTGKDISKGSGGGGDEVYRVSEIKSLTKSTRVINSMCVRAEVQKLVTLPTMVTLPPRVAYSFKMLSFILDALTTSSFEDIPTRREFLAVASRRRDKIIGSVASVPFLVRTILLIENEEERDAITKLSIVRNVLFRPESVDLWLVALLSGGERARACASHYLCLISSSSLSGLLGRKMRWSTYDAKRFLSLRKNLYDEIRKLVGFLPSMLHLGDSLYEVSTRRVVKHVVENTIGRPLPVYVMLMELVLLLLLITAYRIIVELVYAYPSEQFLSNYRDFWGLAFSIAVYFAIRDLDILVAFLTIDGKLALNYISGFGNIVGFATIISVLTMLSIMYVDSNVDGWNYTGIVCGLLWWMFLLHVKGMSEHLSTLIYTIVQISGTLKCFMAIFFVLIFFFADMIDIVKKTTGECDTIEGDSSNRYLGSTSDEGGDDLNSFCSLSQPQSYLAMYFVMIGGLNITNIEGSNPLVDLIFIHASFCGVIIMVNILIAIVTGEYAKALESSASLFARARLESAARQVAREKFLNPKDDPTSGNGRIFWRHFARFKNLAMLVVMEYFLIKSLSSCSKLRADGIIEEFTFVSLVLFAVLYHILVVAATMYILTRAICRYERLRWIRGSKVHRVMFKLFLLPVHRYLALIGLGTCEKCPETSDIHESDRPLSRDEYARKQSDFQTNMEVAILASETRILHALKSMLMFDSKQHDSTQSS